MNKNISSEFAFGLILLIAIIIGGIFLMTDRLGSREYQYVSETNITEKPTSFNKQINVSFTKKEIGKPVVECKPRYFEGEAEVRAWLISENDKNLNVKIKNEDIEKLPTTKTDSLNANFIATLIDPTDEVRRDLQDSSEDRPVNLIIHGYAQICQDVPAVSIKQATIAFKKG